MKKLNQAETFVNGVVRNKANGAKPDTNVLTAAVTHAFGDKASIVPHKCDDGKLMLKVTFPDTSHLLMSITPDAAVGADREAFVFLPVSADENDEAALEAALEAKIHEVLGAACGLRPKACDQKPKACDLRPFSPDTSNSDAKRQVKSLADVIKAIEAMGAKVVHASTERKDPVEVADDMITITVSRKKVSQLASLYNDMARNTAVQADMQNAMARKIMDMFPFLTESR